MGTWDDPPVVPKKQDIHKLEKNISELVGVCPQWFLVPGTLNIPKQPFSWNRCFVETLKKNIYIIFWSLPNETSISTWVVP